MPRLHALLTRLVGGSVACVTALLMLGCAATQTPNATPPLKVAWPVDNTTKIDAYDLGVYGAPAVKDTQLGKALCFGGKEDGIVFPVNPLDAQYDFTIEVLFKPDPDGEAKQHFLHIEDKGEGRATLELRLARNGKFFVHSFVRSGELQQDIENNTATYPASEWHWAQLTYAEGMVQLFVNGELQARVPLELNRMKQGEMSVGTRLNRESWFKGCVRELRFANAALPPEQLATKPAE